MNDKPPPISSLNPALKRVPGLEKTLLKTLAKDPAARYQTMLDLSAALNESKAKPSIAKAISNQIETMRLTGQLTKVLIAGGILTFLLVLVTAALGYPRPILQGANMLPPDVVELNVNWPVYPPPVEPKAIDDLSFKELKVKAETAIRMATTIDAASTVRDPQSIAKRYADWGKMAFEYGRYEDAITWFNRAAHDLNACASDHACIEESQRQTSLRQVYTYLGECHYSMKNYFMAEKWFHERIMVDQKIYIERNWLYDHEAFVKASLMQADCLYRLGKNENLKKAYEIFSGPGFDAAVLSLPPLYTSTASSEFATIEMNLGRPKYAKDLYARAGVMWAAVEGKGKYVPIVHGGEAQSLADLGDFPLAKDRYEKACREADGLQPSEKSDPAIASLYENYSNLLAKHSSLIFDSSDFFHAIQLYGKAKQLRHS
jgi:tetratricopeptide (TPR) repeat protein